MNFGLLISYVLQFVNAKKMHLSFQMGQQPFPYSAQTVGFVFIFQFCGFQLVSVKGYFVCPSWNLIAAVMLFKRLVWQSERVRALDCKCLKPTGKQAFILVTSNWLVIAGTGSSFKTCSNPPLVIVQMYVSYVSLFLICSCSLVWLIDCWACLLPAAAAPTRLAMDWSFCSYAIGCTLQP